jgi:membrane peptidoglycan carboxypeptidase
MTERPRAPVTLDRDCSCGSYDSATQYLFTDALIAYFNETATFRREDFTISNYTRKYEKGWNTIYREAADSSNVQLANASESTNLDAFLNSSLELSANPTSKDHLIVGAETKL